MGEMGEQIHRMKTCVMITGTNGVGKSTLARNIIAYYGGIKCYVDGVTYCNAGNIAFGGNYLCVKYGGVDGFKKTSILESLVDRGLKNSDVIILEGSFLDTFGLNLTNAIFKAKNQLIVSLYAQRRVIYDRISARTDKKNQNFRLIFKKQVNALVSARKWASIGVQVLQINTGLKSADEIAQEVISRISELTQG